MTKKRYQIQAKCYDSRGKLVSSGNNSYTKTHPIQSHFAKISGEPYKQFLHAEILALLRARDRRIHTLEITNLTSTLLPYPCKTCAKAIEAYGVSNVILKSKPL